MATPQPLPGLKIKPPLQNPRSDEHLVGYSQVEPEAGCCKCDTLTSGGITAVILLALFFPAAACVPCCMESCHEPFQRPDYSSKTGGTTAGIPVDGHTTTKKDTQGYAAPTGQDAYSAQPASGGSGYTSNTTGVGNGTAGYTQPGNTQGYGQTGGAGYPDLNSREATANQGYVEMGGKQL